MKKIISLFLFSLLLFNSTYATIWDVLYVKNTPTIVRAEPVVNSNIIATLKVWYVILDEWSIWTKWNRVRLTDGKEWYVYNFNVANISSNKYEIKWNIGNLKHNFVLRSWASSKANSIWLVKKYDNFEVLHLNYINSTWLKVRMTTWKNKYITWYLNKEYVNLVCADRSNYNDIFKLKSSPLYWKLTDTTYCARNNNIISNTTNVIREGLELPELNWLELPEVDIPELDLPIIVEPEIDIQATPELDNNTVEEDEFEDLFDWLFDF